MVKVLRLWFGIVWKHLSYLNFTSRFFELSPACSQSLVKRIIIISITMAIDRLPALLEAQSDDEDDDHQGEPDDSEHILMEDTGSDEFVQQVEEIREMIDLIKEKIEKVKQLHTVILLSPQSDDLTQQELEDLMSDIKSYANKVRNRIKFMEHNIQDLEAEETKSIANFRIRKIQHFALSKQFSDVMNEYNHTQTDYRERCKKRILRQLEITGRVTTTEELEDMLEEGNPAVFTSQGIIVETDEARLALDDIEARHADIIKLETSIRELHDMFMDMARIIEGQGEMIDHIEFNVQSASEHVQKGDEDIKMAYQYLSKARQNKIKLIAILTIAFIVLLLLIIYL